MPKRIITILLSIAVFSFIFVMILQAVSKEKFTRYMAFTRVLRKNLVKQTNTFDLRNSYYIAGTANGSFFLGNPKDPLDLLIIDSSLNNARHMRLSIANSENLKLTGSQIKIDSPFFYVTLGNLPGIFKGTLDHWEAFPIRKRLSYFTQAVPIASGSFALLHKSDEESRMIVSKTSGTVQMKLNPEFPPEQGDTLSNIGMLRYSKELNRLVYVYFYRDEYQVMDSNLNVLDKSSTIDTTSHAHIKPMELFEPELVNLDVQIHKDLLFIWSNLVAMNESLSFIQTMSVIDVYDIKGNTYLFSFYVPDYKGLKMNSFRITEDGMLVLYDHFAVTYIFTSRLNLNKRAL